MQFQVPAEILWGKGPKTQYSSTSPAYLSVFDHLQRVSRFLYNTTYPIRLLFAKEEEVFSSSAFSFLVIICDWTFELEVEQVAEDGKWGSVLCLFPAWIMFAQMSMPKGFRYQFGEGYSTYQRDTGKSPNPTLRKSRMLHSSNSLIVVQCPCATLNYASRKVRRSLKFAEQNFYLIRGYRGILVRKCVLGNVAGNCSVPEDTTKTMQIYSVLNISR